MVKMTNEEKYQRVEFNKGLLKNIERKENGQLGHVCARILLLIYLMVCTSVNDI